LLLYQNQLDDALRRIELLKEGRVSVDGKDSLKTISNQTILDDVYWLEAKLRQQQGDFERALALLAKIQTEYPDDILADDAMYMEAEFYERQLKNNDIAMELYREFLTKFPGSVYAVEARKRLRTLPGDFANQDSGVTKKFAKYIACITNISYLRYPWRKRMRKEETVDYHIRVAWHAIARMYNQQAAKFDADASMAMGFVLLNINTEEGTPATKIAPMMGLEARSLTRLLKTMEEKGLIYREADKVDKRSVRIRLTARGKQSKENAKEKVL